MRRRHRALYVLPSVTDDTDPKVKNALAIRNAASVSGRCPSCGAVMQIVSWEPGEIGEARMEHEHDCPALVDEERGG